jgi:hypothetical protein
MNRVLSRFSLCLGVALLFAGSASLFAPPAAGEGVIGTAQADRLFGGADPCSYWDLLGAGCGVGNCGASCSNYQLDGVFTISDAYGVISSGNCGQDPYGECGVYENVSESSCTGGSSY